MTAPHSSFFVSSTSFSKLVTELQGLPRRVQTRAIVPHVSGLLQQGFPLAYILEILAEKGIAFKPTTLHQAVYRWRKQQRQDGSARDLVGAVESGQTRDASARFTEQNNEQEPLHRDAGHSANHVVPNYPTNPGVELRGHEPVDPLAYKQQLKQLRDQHIDLDEINRQARARRSADQQSIERAR